MTLKADIKYKSNWQQGAVKGTQMFLVKAMRPLITKAAKRRNKWICALKNTLAEVGIFGPSGNPNAKTAGPTKYTLVPWEEVQREERDHAGEHRRSALERMPTEGWDLTDKNALSWYLLLFPAHSS
jgi:hypothetical protein